MNRYMDSRSILSDPHLYKFFQDLVRGGDFYRFFSREHVKSEPGSRILDIGCGTADVLECLNGVEYVGFDMSKKYIDFCKRRFAGRGLFICEKVSRNIMENSAPFDTIMANGILHHLDDDDFIQLLDLSQALLKKGGRLITYDGCYIDGQPWFEKYLLSKDRGKFVRSREGYLALIKKVFSNVHDTIYHDKFNVPYPLLIIECTPENDR